MNHEKDFIYYTPIGQDNKSSHLELNPEYYKIPESSRFYPSDVSFSQGFDDFELYFSHEEQDIAGGKTIISEYKNENEFKLLIEFGAGLGFLGGVILEFSGIDISREINLNIEDFAWEIFLEKKF